MKCTVLAVLMSVVVMGFAGSAGAVLLYYEGFNYPLGEGLAGQNGWVNQWGPTAMIVDGLSYPGLTSSGNAVSGEEGGDNDFDDAVLPLFSTHGTYYITALLKQADENSSAPQFALETGLGTGTPTIVFAYLGGGGQSTLYIMNDGGEHIGNTGANHAMGDTHLFAIRVINQEGADDIRLVVDPTLPDEPDWDSPTYTVDWMDITNSKELRGAHFRGNPGGTLFDELRLADTWAEAIPEPATLCLLGLGGLALLRRRR